MHPPNTLVQSVRVEYMIYKTVLIDGKNTTVKTRSWMIGKGGTKRAWEEYIKLNYGHLKNPVITFNFEPK